MYTTLQYTLQTVKEAAVMTTLVGMYQDFVKKCSLFDDYMYMYF